MPYKLYSWGANSYGQLGIGTRCELVAEPTYVNLSHFYGTDEHPLAKEVKLCGGGGHSLLLNGQGEVYGCGLNNIGQLIDHEGIHTEFFKLPNVDKYKLTKIATKWDSCYGVTEDGKCIGWGANVYGQLGVSTEKLLSARRPLILAERVAQVDCGIRHSVILLKNGQVLTAGDYRRGQLGRPFTILDSTHKQVQGLQRVRMIACGSNHTIALTKDEILYGWGCNRFGQLGIDPKLRQWVSEPTQIPFPCDLPRIASIHCGWSSSSLLTETGIILHFGRNNYGQLGENLDEILCPWEPHLLDVNETILRMSVGSEHTIVETADNEIFSWGWNEHGSCGVGHTKNIFRPEEILMALPHKVITFEAGAGQSFLLV